MPINLGVDQRRLLLGKALSPQVRHKLTGIVLQMKGNSQLPPMARNMPPRQLWSLFQKMTGKQFTVMTAHILNEAGWLDLTTAASPGGGGTNEVGATGRPQPPGLAKAQSVGSARVQSVGSAKVPTVGSGNAQSIGSARALTIGSGKVQTVGSAKVLTVGSGRTQTVGSGKVQLGATGQPQRPFTIAASYDGTVGTTQTNNSVTNLQNDLDSDNEISEMTSMQLQMLMDTRSRLFQTACDIAKSTAGTEMAIVGNVKQ